MIKDYLYICRFDHWFKQIFMIPGIIYGIFYQVDILKSNIEQNLIFNIIVCFFSISFAASANYSINEYLDKSNDRNHPTKKDRPAAQGKIKLKFLLLQYTILIVISYIFSFLIGYNFFILITVFLILGIIYNIPPLRTKDHKYIDVISESANNVVRLIAGTYAISTQVPIPSSLALAYWFGGAFLMNSKRLAEFKQIKNKKILNLYRKSLARYTENSLISISLFYGMITVVMLQVFITKYKPEVLLTLPFIVIAFSLYLYDSLNINSFTISPEKIYKSKKIQIQICIILILLIISFYIKVDVINILLTPII
jgi:decaprenyl-phosphate phosphoribosyltransferase